MRQRKRNSITKTYLHTTSVGGFYSFKIYEVVDAGGNVWYIGEPVGHGGTKVADTIEELRAKLELQVEPLNRFLSKTR